MDATPSFWTIPLGMFAGILCVPFITHWLRLLLTTIGKHPDNDPLPPPRNVGLIIFTVLHPVPWLLIVGLPLGVFRLYSQPPSDQWLWFFGAAATSLVGLFVFSFTAARRIRQNSLKKMATQRSENDVV